MAKNIARTLHNKYIFYLDPNKMPLKVVKGYGDLSNAVYMTEIGNYFYDKNFNMVAYAPVCIYKPSLQSFGDIHIVNNEFAFTAKLRVTK